MNPLSKKNVASLLCTTHQAAGRRTGKLAVRVASRLRRTNFLALSLGLAVAGLSPLGSRSAQAVTRTYTGAANGDIGTATNWSGATLPSSAAGDTALFDGSVAGNLTLTDTTTALGGAAADVGLTLNLASTQTGSVSIDSGANAAGALRLLNVNISSGAGAFTLGDGAGTFTINIAGGAGAVDTFANNSANTATINSDVAFNASNGNAKVLLFTGSGNWLANNNLNSANNANANAVTKAGTGSLTLTGANTFAGGITVQGGTLNIGNGTAGSVASNALTFNVGGGTANFAEAAGATQAMGTVTFTAGNGRVVSTYGGSGTSTLTFANVAARAAGATGNFVVSGGANGTTNKIVFTQFAGAAPTTGALLDRGVFFNGNSYAAYDTGGFVRAYGAGDANYATAAGANGIASVATNNTALTADVTGQNSASVNTLNLGAFNVGLSASQTLQTNGILSAGNANATISGGTALQASSIGAELVVRVDGATDSLNISTPVTALGTNALTKSGAGTLTLSAAAANTYTGATTVAQGTLTLTGTITGGGALTVNSGTFNGNSSGTNTLGNFSVAGTTSSSTLTSGTYNVTATTGLTTVDNGSTLTVNGATLNVSGTGSFLPIGNTANTTSTVTVNSGTVNVTNNFGVEVGRVGNGVLNVNGGTFIVSDTQGTAANGAVGLILGDQTTAQSGTVNLNGGTLRVSKVSGGSGGTDAFNFNGGTLQANGAANQGTTAFWAASTRLTANVRNGGGIIDNNGTAITIAQALVHSTIAGDSAIDGGMNFRGTGTTTLTGTNTYTGGTTVSGGILSLTAAGSTLGTGNVTVLGTAISLTIATGVTNAIADTAILSLAGGGVAGTADNGYLALGANVNETVGGLILGGITQANGTYGAVGSGATFTNNEYFSGTGILTVVPEPGTYAMVIGGFGLLAGFCARRRRA